MRLPEFFAFALLWQSSLLVNIGAVATPEHLRYQRTVRVFSGGSGVACAPLDATVLAHTASPAHNDLRLFQRLPNAPEAEIPYVLTESGPEPVADTELTPEHVEHRSTGLGFDLRMPDRPYSEIRLRLRLQNFVGTARVTARDTHGRHADLGSFAIFDLSSRHLGRWTSLLMQESSWPELHIDIDLRTPAGAPLFVPAPNLLEGAAVPPSRERQTVFVPTIGTHVIRQRGWLSVAMLRVPAHVPVERVAFELAPGFSTNFSREVTVTARPDGEPITDTEAIDAGAIGYLSMPAGDPRLNPLDVRQTTVDATLGATLVRGATVLVAVHNAGAAPLPIRGIALEMRERKVCFFADREAVYTLRYGDPALAPPIYDTTQLAVPAQPIEARLGPEENNPRFNPRRDERPYLERHPELFWIVVLACAGLMGGMALHHVQHRRV